MFGQKQDCDAIKNKESTENKSRTSHFVLCLFCTLYSFDFFAAAATAAGEGNNEAAEKARNQLLKTVFTEGANAVPVLIESLDNERTAVRRTAAHLVRYLGNSARAAFRPGLKVEDEHVSRVVLDAVAQAGVLDQYIEPVVTHQADSVRRYFYHRLLPEQVLTDGQNKAQDLKRAVSYQAVAIAYRNLGYIYRDQLDEPESAIKAFKNAAERDWASHVNHSSVLSAAAILRDLGRPKEALDILSEEIPKEINDMGNNWGPRYVRSFANTLQDLGDYEAAIGYYRRMLEADFGKKHNEQAEKAIKKLQQKK